MYICQEIHRYTTYKSSYSKEWQIHILPLAFGFIVKPSSGAGRGFGNQQIINSQLSIPQLVPLILQCAFEPLQKKRTQQEDVIKRAPVKSQTVVYSVENIVEI